MYLKDIITSEVRIKILIELFSETEKSLYVRELTRRVGTEINAVRRELKRLTSASIIKREKRGNRIYYLLRRDHPFYYDLVSMVSKEYGVGKKIVQSSSELGKVRLALLAVPFAEGRKSAKNELDLLLVGDVNLEALSNIVKEATAEMNRDINYTVLNTNEFEYLKGRRDAFTLAFLISPTILLLGDPAKYLTFR